MRKKDLNEKFFSLFDKYPRDFFVASFFWLLFLIIIFKVFSYTILNHKYYKDLASAQHISESKVEVKRWSIYSNNDWWALLATWVNLDILAIDPLMPWDKNKLSIFLTDIIYRQICYLKTKWDCESGLAKFIKVLKIEDFDYSDDFIKWKILERIKNQISRSRVTSVLLFDNLSVDESYDLTRLNLSWVYINGKNLYVNPEEVFNEDFTIDSISSIIPLDKEKIKYSIRKRDLRYIPIYNKISIWVSDIIKSTIESELESYRNWLIKEDDMISKFIILTPESTRYYPEKTLAAQTIWFVDSNMQWHYGLEGYFNNDLRWKIGATLSLKDTMWRVIDPIWVDYLDAVWWVNIISTIDRNIQKKVEMILEDWVRKYNANKWSVIVMDPKNGHILAMSNYPTFDPNYPWDVFEIERITLSDFRDPKTELLWIPILVEDKKRWTDFYYNWNVLKLRELDREEIWNFDTYNKYYKYKNNFWAWVYRNSIVQDLYEPWSIFKPITVAIWLDIDEISRYDRYEDKWFVTIDNFKIKNVDDKCLWLNSYQHALNYSCNVWMIRIVQKIGSSIFSKYLDSFWFWRLTWITLDWEVFWKINPYEKWSKAQLFTSSFWQWITTTILQMAASYSVLANWWIYVQPQIVKQLSFDDWRVVNYNTEAKTRVIKNEVSDLMTEMLVDSIDNWVAKNWWVEWYRIAWKTWTSQIAYKWKYEIGHATTIWSFAWYWPAEDPRFVIIVMLDRPRTNQYWWQTAAFIFKDISKFLLDYYMIPKKIVNE